MTIASGTKLGPYEVLEPIGAGGMGEVYKATDTRLDRTVAIKVLPSHVSDHPQVRERFEREARTISQLNHPHICTLHDVGRENGVDFLVMEHIEGDTLADRIGKGALPLDQALQYGIEIADALDKAHRQGVVHRDLKPGNVMLTKSGAKLLDFGLAKTGMAVAGSDVSELATEARPLTEQGTILGTLQYMAPEQLEGKDADARTDIFALGGVVYEMVTGRRAFEGKSPASVIGAILRDDPPPLSTVQPMTPPLLDHVIRRCLAKAPDDRWQTASDVMLELKWLAEGGVSSGISAPEPVPRTRHQKTFATLAALFFVTTVVLGLAYYRSVQETPPVIRAIVPPPDGTRYLSTALAGFVGASPVALSPDGSQLAFVARGKGEDVLWVRALDSLTARPLPGTEGARYPFWSPDGSMIGFDADGKLKKIDLDGGPPVTICTTDQSRGASWSRKGVIVFTPWVRNPLFQVSENGGEPVQLTELDSARGETSHRWPYFLPNGNHFLYFARIGSGEDAVVSNAVMLGSLDGKTSKLLLNADGNAAYGAGHLLFMRENILMGQRLELDNLRLTGSPFPIVQEVEFDPPYSRGVFSVSENGVLAYQARDVAAETSTLVWFDRDGKQLGSLGEPDLYFGPQISSDGKKVVAGVGVGLSDLWIFDVARPVPTRFTLHRAANKEPVWSPDGTRIAFSSNQNPEGKPPTASNIFVKPVAGSGDLEPLIEGEFPKYPHSWSPDGRFFAYTALRENTKSDILILPLFGDRKTFDYLATPESEGGGEFSPDGRWFAYNAEHAGRWEVYVASFPKPELKTRISTGGGWQPTWRGDGREIFYIANDGQLMAVAIDQDSESLEVGRTKALFPTQTTRTFEPRFGAYDVSNDGQRFLVNTLVETPRVAAITLVTNWTAEFEQ